jgi:hypothetical protein
MLDGRARCDGLSFRFGERSSVHRAWWPQLSPWSGQLWRCTLGRMSSVLVASTTPTLGGRMNCSYSLNYDQNR